MSLKSTRPTQIPELTAHVAKNAFPKGNIYIEFRDHFGFPFEDEEFEPLYSTDGRKEYSPARLAFVSIVQALEGLSDRQMAEAVRARIDLKYALGLALDDQGFNFSVLSRFRLRLVQGSQEELIFAKLLQLFHAPCRL